MSQEQVGATAGGAIVWFTGLPSSGKSRLARHVRARLAADGVACCVLDGDRIRGVLHPTPGYSRPERDDFYRTLGDLALELEHQGLVVLVPATADRRAYRDGVRARACHFIEVWMNASLDECRQRDGKQLYAQLASGDVHGLPGSDSGYEAPQAPEVSANGGDDENALSEIERRLRARRVPDAG